jgi:hypothetical protein
MEMCVGVKVRIHVLLFSAPKRLFHSRQNIPSYALHRRRSERYGEKRNPLPFPGENYDTLVIYRIA